MTKKDQQPVVRSMANDQRLDLATNGNELRKGVNVLNTSDSKNPAPNPFVQSQNQSGTSGQPANKSSDNNSNGQEKGSE